MRSRNNKEFKDEQPCFTLARKKLNQHILHFGYTDSFDEYAKWLWKADLLPVTSNQDFFGSSIMEAVYCQTIPLLPRRLTYPELFHTDNNSQLFYECSDELIENLTLFIHNISNIQENNCKAIAACYDWSKMVKVYDEILVTLTS